MPSIGWQELVLVLVIVLLIFGTKRLPEVGRSVGSALKEFKAGTLEKSEDKQSAAAAAVPVEPKREAVETP